MNKKECITYLPVNKQDMAWGMIVTTTGYQDIVPCSVYPAGLHPSRYLFSTDKGRVLDEYQLVYISRGHGFFSSAKQGKTKIKAGDIFLLFPGEWHTYNPYPESGWYEYWIGFKGINIDNRVEAGFFRKEEAVFHAGVNEQIIHLFKQAVVTAKEQKTGFQQMLAGIVNMLLGYIYFENRQTLFSELKVDNQVEKAKIFMYENINNDLTMEDVAAQVGMGYSWFRRVFKEYTGFAPAHYLQELRINKSKEFLMDTNLSCQEIAYQMGFETPSYFNAAFKKSTGMTPLNYRKRKF